MDIFSFPIPRHIRSKLWTSKYVAIRDFQGLSAEKLSYETGLSDAEAKELLSIIGVKDGPRTYQPSPSLTAAELLENGKKNRAITTSSKKLDEMLGGGIPLSRLTEICGIPGSGKTQLCMQLALNVQIANGPDGFRGEALYIDTEGSFSSERLADMAKAAFSAGPSSDEVVCGVHYHRCLDCASLLDAVNAMHDFISSHDKVRLVVIDNIAYHFRKDFASNYKLRTRTMHNVAQILAELAFKYSIAVVLTNQMTTRIDKDGQTVVVPSLGDSWSHACSNRVVLSFDSRSRSAMLLKSSYQPFSTAFFQIETGGIRDVPVHAESHSSGIAASQLGSYANSIGTSELEINTRDEREDPRDDENTVNLGAAAKRRRLDLEGAAQV